MSDAIHNFFELSYAQYLTVPRSVLQSMPDEWQERFVGLLGELDEWIDWLPEGTQYRTRLHVVNPESEGEDYWGEVLDDPLMDYERGRRRVPSREAEQEIKEALTERNRP